MSRAPTPSPADAVTLGRALASLDARIVLRGVQRTGPARRHALARDAVIVPARDEASRIDACLVALSVAASVAADRAPDALLAIVVANDCTDASVATARAAARRAGLDALVLDVALPPGGVGLARAAGCAVALETCPALCRLHTSDADAWVEPDWLMRANAHLDVCDVVCGRIEPIAEEASALPASLHAPGALEHRYLQLVLESEARLDPDPWNPWPYHGRASGASLSIRCTTYRETGGFAPLPSGEDVELVRRVRAHDGSVRFADDVRVQASCRLDGRAPGGMADALARRVADADSLADTLLEPARTHLLRVRSRARLRGALARRSPPHAELERLGLEPRALAVYLSPGEMTFGRYWAAVEALSPRLVRRRLRPSELPAEIALLERALGAIKTAHRARARAAA